MPSLWPLAPKYQPGAVNDDARRVSYIAAKFPMVTFRDFISGHIGKDGDRLGPRFLETLELVPKCVSKNGVVFVRIEIETRHV